MKPRALALAVAVFGVLAPNAAATTTKVSANGDHLTTHEVTQGRFFVQTRDAWQRQGRDGLRTATFLIRPEQGCTVKVLVSLRGVAAKNGPRTQVRSATRAGVAVLGEGDGRAGPWRVVLMSNDTLYAIASKRIADRRYGQVRALGFASGSCTNEALRQIGAHLVKLIRTARVEVKVRRT